MRNKDKIKKCGYPHVITIRTHKKFKKLSLPSIFSSPPMYPPIIKVQIKSPKYHS